MDEKINGEVDDQPTNRVNNRDGNLFKNRPRASTSEYKQPPNNLRLFQNTLKFLDNFFLSNKVKIRKGKKIHPDCPVLNTINSIVICLNSISTFHSSTALIFMLLLSRNYVCRVDPSISD